MKDNRSVNLKRVSAVENPSRRRSPEYPSDRQLNYPHQAVPDPRDKDRKVWFCVGKCAQHDYRAYEISALSSNARLIGSSKLLPRYLKFKDNYPYYHYRLKDANTNKEKSVPVHRAMARAIELPIDIDWLKSPPTPTPAASVAGPATTTPASHAKNLAHGTAAPIKQL